MVRVAVSLNCMVMVTRNVLWVLEEVVRLGLRYGFHKHKGMVMFAITATTMLAASACG